MTIGNFTSATRRILKHAGCAGELYASDHKLACSRCGCVLRDPGEIAQHDPIEVPKVRPGYPTAVVEAWS